MLERELSAAGELARQAGRILMEIYAHDFAVRYKGKNDPVTEADQLATLHRAMVAAGVLHAQPKTIEERAQVAATCALTLNLRMPMLLDEMTNDVDTKYAALPERLYVLDAGGRVFFKSVMGSMGFDVEAWARAIEEVAQR